MSMALLKLSSAVLKWPKWRRLAAIMKKVNASSGWADGRTIVLTSRHFSNLLCSNIAFQYYYMLSQYHGVLEARLLTVYTIHRDNFFLLRPFTESNHNVTYAIVISSNLLWIRFWIFNIIFIWIFIVFENFIC